MQTKNFKKIEHIFNLVVELLEEFYFFLSNFHLSIIVVEWVTELSMY